MRCAKERRKRTIDRARNSNIKRRPRKTQNTNNNDDDDNRKEGKPDMSLPFSDELVKQCKQLSGIFNRAHAIRSYLTIVSLVTGSAAIIRVMTSPFLGKDVPDVNTEDVLKFQNVDTTDVLCKWKRNRERVSRFG